MVALGSNGSYTSATELHCGRLATGFSCEQKAKLILEIWLRRSTAPSRMFPSDATEPSRSMGLNDLYPAFPATAACVRSSRPEDSDEVAVITPRMARTLVLTALASGSCLACSCSFPSIPNAVKKADLVFRGRLINVEFIDDLRYVAGPIAKGRQAPIPRRFLATLEVTDVWKGLVGRRIVLHTREDSSDCVGFWTDVGKEYLIFANVGHITPKRAGEYRIPEWTDRLAIGRQIISPGVCTLNEQIDANTVPKLKALGRSRPPIR